MERIQYTITGVELPHKVYTSPATGEVLELFKGGPGQTLVEILADNEARCNRILEIELDRGMFKGCTASTGEWVPLF